MDNERIKEAMEKFGIYPMCLNCSKCNKTYGNVIKDNTIETYYRCQANNGRDIAHPRMHCHKWEPNTNMQILFGTVKVEPKTTEYENKAIEKSDEQGVELRIKMTRIHGLGSTYKRMHDELKDKMDEYKKAIDPLETKERALKALIYENAKPEYLPHYQEQLDKISKKLDALYLEYDPMAERLKELYNKSQKYTYWVPGIPDEDKPKAERPKTIQEYVDENMPSNEEIIEFLGLGRVQKMQARVDAEIRRANAIIVARRAERESSKRKNSKAV